MLRTAVAPLHTETYVAVTTGVSGLGFTVTVTANLAPVVPHPEVLIA